MYVPGGGGAGGSMVLMLTLYESQNVANVCTHFCIGVKKNSTLA